MMQPAKAQQVDTGGAVSYEQPLNERMRTFLRLEYLGKKYDWYIGRQSHWASRAVISAVLEIVAILSRGDVRSDVLKELERQVYVFDQYQNSPDVDITRLTEIIRRIEALRKELISVGPQYLQPIKESEFLSAIKHRSAIPGGTCEFDLPEYNHWLRKPADARRRDIDKWMQNVRPLLDGVGALMWLLRGSAQPTRHTARNGVFQHLLTRGSGAGLIRITLPGDARLFPEISGSHHRFSIRFMQWSDVENRAVACTDNTDFDLTVC